MDSRVSLLLTRADNEVIVAKVLNNLSESSTQAEELKIPKGTTFYSSVISHSYYGIFFAARAYLHFKDISYASEQGIHQVVYVKFKKLVEQRVIDRELLDIYEEAKVKAESLLGILWSKRKKRKTFTYETFPQANKEPAEESLNNAAYFIGHIKTIIEKANDIKKQEEKRA